MAFNPQASLDENKNKMTEAIHHVRTGQVTFAVRDSKYENLEIHEGDFLGIADGKIVTTTKDVLDSAFELLTQMLQEEDEILTVIFGEDINEDQVKELVKRISESYPELEIEIHNGGQPLYSFIFSIEE